MNHNCKKCSLPFASRQSRWRHEQKCNRSKFSPTPQTNVDIPTFNGSDFLGGNPPKETIEKLRNHIKTKTLDKSMKKEKAMIKHTVLDAIINGKGKLDKTEMDIDSSEFLSSNPPSRETMTKLKNHIKNQAINEIVNSTTKSTQSEKTANLSPKQKNK